MGTALDSVLYVRADTESAAFYRSPEDLQSSPAGLISGLKLAPCVAGDYHPPPDPPLNPRP